MSRVRTMLVVLLALLWAPITSHCLFERLPGFDFLACCNHEEASAPHEDDDCSTDACAVVEAGCYKLQDHEDLLVPATEVQLQPVIETKVILIAVTHPPPDLAVGWQFTHRAALPIRAPSSLL